MRKFSDPADSSFAFELARNTVPGMTAFVIYGRNPAITAAEDIWGAGGTWAPPVTASTVNFVSTSANDTSAGTGARTILIEGLDSTYALASETLSLNGLTNVLTTNTYWMIYRVTVQTAGSTGSQAGIITGTSTAAGTPIMSQITDQNNRSQNSFFQVPIGYQAFVSAISVESIPNTNSSCVVAMIAKPFGGVAYKATEFLLSANPGGGIHALTSRDLIIPYNFPGQSIIKFRATPTAGSWDVIVTYSIVLFKDGYLT